MVTSYPSIDMNHADIKAIAFLLALASRRADLASALTAMLGDGAPTLKFAAFQRAELCRLMKEVPADDVAQQHFRQLYKMQTPTQMMKPTRRPITPAVPVRAPPPSP